MSSTAPAGEVRIVLTRAEYDLLLESLKFSNQRVRDGKDAPPPIRDDKLARLDAVTRKLRDAAEANPP